MNKLSYNTFSRKIFGLITPQKLWLFHSPGIPIEAFAFEMSIVYAPQNKRTTIEWLETSMDASHNIEHRGRYVDWWSMWLRIPVKILFMFPDRNRKYLTLIDNKMESFSILKYFLLFYSERPIDAFHSTFHLLIFVCLSSRKAFQSEYKTIWSTKMSSLWR